MDSATKTKTTKAADRKATARAKQAPALPLTGTNPALDAMIEAARKGLTGFITFHDDGTSAGGKRFSAYVSGLRAAHDVMMEAPVFTVGEAETKLHAYLMAEGLLHLEDRKWRRLTVERATSILDDEGAGHIIAFALLTFRADMKRLAAAPEPSPAQSASADLRAAEAAYDAAWAAHDAAVTAYGVLEQRQLAGTVADDDPDLSAADDAVDHTSDVEDTAWMSFMATPAATTADLIHKMKRYDGCEVVRNDPETATKSFAFILADVERLTPGSPPSAPGRAAWNAAVAEYDAAMAVEIGPTGECDLERIDRALNCLLALSPPDILGVRDLFEAVMIHTQALHTREAEELDLGSEPVTAERLGDSVGWAETPMVVLEQGKGLLAGLVLIRRALDRLAASDGPAAQSPPPQWVRAVARYQLAKADDLSKLEAAHAASDAVEAEAPVPAALLMASGGWYRHEDLITNDRRLTSAQKAELLELLRDFLPVREAARARHGEQEADDAWEASAGGWPEFIELIDEPAPSLEALTEKVRLYLSEVHCELTGESVDTVDTISKFLTDSDAKGPWGPVRIYQDLLRLTGQRPDLAWARPFDVESWIAAFKDLPGHGFSEGGDPVYQEEELHGQPPVGSTHWHALTDWQQEAVRSHPRARPMGECERTPPDPFDPAAARAELSVAGVEVWPGMGFLFPGGFSPAAQQALADLTEAEKQAVIEHAAGEAVLIDTREQRIAEEQAA